MYSMISRVGNLVCGTGEGGKFRMYTSCDRVERVKSKFVVTTLSAMYNTGSATIV